MRGHGKLIEAATERAMRVQEVILRPLTKKITGWQAAETGAHLLNLHVTAAATGIWHSFANCSHDA